MGEAEPPPQTTTKTMKTDINGCSTCPRGSENYEAYNTRINGKVRRMIQYDYRTHDGALFSCIATSLEDAREKRDRWMENR